MKIAILGTRGIPANYGGFETFAEECSAGLVARGHQVTVYGRSHYVPKTLKTHRGVKLVVLPTLKWKYTDTVVHSFFSILHALFRKYDVILICNAANSIYAWMPRILGIPVVVNVDGIERLRRKWNRLGKAYYHLCEYLSTCFPNVIVTDAKVIERYYRDRYGAASVFIPYGTTTEKPEAGRYWRNLGLIPGEYFLYVSRFEPENNAHLVVKAFEKVRTSKAAGQLSATLLMQGSTLKKSAQPGIPGLFFPGLSMEKDTGNCRRMHTAISTQPRSGAHIRPSSKPWDREISSSQTEHPKIPRCSIPPVFSIEKTTRTICSDACRMSPIIPRSIPASSRQQSNAPAPLTHGTTSSTGTNRFFDNWSVLRIKKTEVRIQETE